MRFKLLSAALLASGIACSATPVDGTYASLFGGYTYLPGNISNSYLGPLLDNTGYNKGYHAGGRIGYQSNPIRYELEYTYLHGVADQFDVNQLPQTGVTGFSSGNLLMGNLYYDFPDIISTLSPFIGGGLGYAYIQSYLKSTGPLSPIYFNATHNVLAYQGTAGITYNFAEHYALNIAYRYVATNKSNDFGKTFQAHLASVGAIYHFDMGNYK